MKRYQLIVSLFNVTFFVRTAIPTMSVVPQLRETLGNLAPTIAFQTPVTIGEVLDDTFVTNRMEGWLFGIFAGIAVLLAVIGIYGVMSYFVSERTREIGIRMALGAKSVDVLGLVSKLGFKLALLGVALGVVLAVVLARVIANFLFEVRPTDPVTYAAVAALLTVVALLACYIPARRAMRVDPMVALRYE